MVLSRLNIGHQGTSLFFQIKGRLINGVTKPIYQNQFLALGRDSSINPFKNESHTLPSYDDHDTPTVQYKHSACYRIDFTPLHSGKCINNKPALMLTIKQLISLQTNKPRDMFIEEGKRNSKFMDISSQYGIS